MMLRSPDPLDIDFFYHILLFLPVIDELLNLHIMLMVALE